MKVSHRAVPLLSFLLAACVAASQDPWAAARPSPDHRHVVTFTNDFVAHLVDIASSREVARVENLERLGIGFFSSDGSVFLTHVGEGSLVALEISSGRTARFGKPVDFGRISPDGSRVAYLANVAHCGASDLQACADLVVSPVLAGSPSKLASGLRVLEGNWGQGALLDHYEFAGNGRLVFTDASGSLRSVSADGAGAPVHISGPVGSSGGSAIPPVWVLSPDGSQVVYADAAGVHAISPAGGTARLLAADSGNVPCGYDALTQRDECGFTADGQAVALVTSPASDAASVSVTLASLAGGVQLSFPASDRYLHLAFGGLLFADPQGNWVVGSNAGVRPIGIALRDAQPHAERDISPDTRWALFSTYVSSLECPSCRTMQVASLAGDSSWTVMDGAAPMKLLDAWFSPDSKRVMLLKAPGGVSPQGTGGGALYVADVERGELKQIADGVADAFWADVSRFVVIRNRDAGDGKAGVFIEAVP